MESKILFVFVVPFMTATSSDGRKENGWRDSSQPSEIRIWKPGAVKVVAAAGGGVVAAPGDDLERFHVAWGWNGVDQLP